jgi:RimJ/RimL family protein N-acetyltransferase
MPNVEMTPIQATLKNGLQITIRPLLPSDRARIAVAVQGLAPETIYSRLFSHRKLTEAAIDRIMRSDAEHEVALVALLGAGSDAPIIGGGRYIVTATQPAPRAEVAFTVEEDYQGQGIAGRLLAALVTLARQRGITVFDAEVLAENPSMLRVFERSGLPVRQRRDGGIVHLELSLA